MKSLTHYIQEKLIIKKNKYNYFPKTREELQDIILRRIKDEGNEVDLNNIDVSKINDMSFLFEGTNFNGDISSWDVSNVTNMNRMFAGCESFNQDISSWDVSNVRDMSFMFLKCFKFNQDISSWDFSNSKYRYSSSDVFNNCPIENVYKPKFRRI